MNNSRRSITVSQIATLLLLTSFPIFTGCTTSGYLNATNPYNLVKGMPRYTPFRKSAFRTNYSNVSWEQKLFEGENAKYITANCEDNFNEFTKLSFIRSITGLENYNIGEIFPLERLETRVCRFYAVLKRPTYRALTQPESAGETLKSYYYFYWGEHGKRLIIFGDYNEPWKNVYAKDTLDEFLKNNP